MYCQNCGTQVQPGAKFCPNCGKALSGEDASTLASKPVTYEYKDFVYTFSSGGWVVNYTPPEARTYFWQGSQRQILSEFQKWIDQGWDPIGEIGPASVSLNSFRSLAGRNSQPIRNSSSAAIISLLYMFGAIATLGLLLIFVPFRTCDYLEPTEVRVQMRRPIHR